MHLDQKHEIKPGEKNILAGCMCQVTEHKQVIAQEDLCICFTKFSNYWGHSCRVDILC